jgi:hypothetical protein
MIPTALGGPSQLRRLEALEKDPISFTRPPLIQWLFRVVFGGANAGSSYQEAQVDFSPRPVELARQLAKGQQQDRARLPGLFSKIAEDPKKTILMGWHSRILQPFYPPATIIRILKTSARR